MLSVQLVVLCVWSAVEAARGVQSADFIGFYQSWYLISHGVLNPAQWWQEQGIFIQWPLATLGLIYPHRVTLLVVQDVAIVLAELVAFFWICDLVHAREEMPIRLYGFTGLALLVLDPWIYWSASWDYHSEPLGILFAVLAARDFFRNRRIAWLWALLTLTSGMIPATYLLGIGTALMLTRKHRRAGVGLAGASVVWFVGLVKLGGGTTIGYASSAELQAGNGGPLSTLAGRLSTLFHSLGPHWHDLFANLAPTGLIGVFTTPVVGIAAVTFGENFSQGNPNSLVPSFQSLPLYIFVPVGTVIALMWIHGRYGRRYAQAVAFLLVLNTIGWAVVWLPKVVPTWLRVDPSQAAALTHVEAMIPQNDSVAVSQGVSGDFANHPQVYAFFSTPASYTIRAPYTWFVVAPYAGIETATPEQSAQLIQQLAKDPRATLEYRRDGIWAFRLRPRGPRDRFTAEGALSSLSAAVFASDGTTSTKGNVSSWYTEGTDGADGPDPVGRLLSKERRQL